MLEHRNKVIYSMCGPQDRKGGRGDRCVLGVLKGRSHRYMRGEG